MTDFSVSLKPGWSKKFRARHGSYEGDVLAISPATLSEIDALRRAPFRSAVPSSIQPIIVDEIAPAQERVSLETTPDQAEELTMA